jgi:hypothetical protein
VTALGGSLAEARDRARRAANYLATGAEEVAAEPMATEGARA